MKKIFFTSLTILAFSSAFPQGGQKWATQGNGIEVGDFLGTTNNEPLLLKANNNLGLKIMPNGELVFKSLDLNSSNVPNGLVFTDGQGRIFRLDLNGNPSYYLAGDGTWNLLPKSVWSAVTGTTDDIYTLGKVGIGTNSPLFALDVAGDVNVSDNLYVGGAVLIGRKVKATTDMETPSLTADTLRSTTIVMGPGRTIDGETTINGEIIAQSKLNVQGNTLLGGNLTVAGTATVGQISINQSISTPVLVTNHIQSTDTIMHFGDSSFTYNFYSGYDRMWSTKGNVAIGGSGTFASGGLAIAIGNSTKATGAKSISIGSGGSESLGANSAAIGWNVKTGSLANNAMALGSGITGNPMLNNTPNSLMIGFNSNLPTLFVGTSTGANTTGKVGIGTTSPDSKLTVYATNEGGITSKTTHAAGFGYNTFIDVNRNNTKALAVVQEGSESGAHFPNENFLVWGDGHTKIGYRVPMNAPYNNAMLTVDGTITSKEVYVVDNLANWADYVFAKDYKLKTLDEVETYVKQNKRLPNMPSAEEIKQNGQAIGKLQVTQMEKIEELFLYIIETNKKLEETNKKVAALEKENKELKKKIK